MIPINTIPTATNEQVYIGNTMLKKDEASVLAESTGVANMNCSSSSNPKQSHESSLAPDNSMLKVSKSSAFQTNVNSYQARPQFTIMPQEQPVSQQHMMMMHTHGQAEYMWNPAQQNNMSGMMMMPASAFAQMQQQTMNAPSMPQQVTKQPQQAQVLDPKKAKKFPMKVCTYVSLKRPKTENPKLTRLTFFFMNFLQLMLVLCNDEYDDILSWNEQGDRFTIHDPKKFCEEILPKFFKASKFPSFLRKLYRWGFVKRPQSKGGGKEIRTYFHPVSTTYGKGITVCYWFSF